MQTIQGVEEHIKKNIRRLITGASDNNVNIRTNGKTTKSKKTKTGRETIVWILGILHTVRL